MKRNDWLFTVHELPVEDVYPDENNARQTFTGIDELAAQIEDSGQLKPVIVRREGDIYFLVSGERRWRAIKQLGWPIIFGFVADDDDQENALRAVMENDGEPLNDLEKSRGVQRCLFRGNPLERVAKTARVSVDYMEKIAGAIEKVNDQTACEDMTLERLGVIAELEDADEIKAVENASEKDWRRVAEGIRRERSEREAVAKAVAIVKDSGRELIDGEHPDGLTYLGAFPEPPEAATHGKPTSWGNVYWYGPAGAEPNPEAEEKAKRRAELEAAHVARLEFIGRHLANSFSTDALTAYAYEAWTRGMTCEARRIPEEWAIKGPTMFFHAAVLAYAETLATETQRGAWNADQKETDRYLAAMKAVGWEEEA